jgi:hypothetical protein
LTINPYIAIGLRCVVGLCFVSYASHEWKSNGCGELYMELCCKFFIT